MTDHPRVVLVCPNDLVIDTRGQKMAWSLKDLGYDVTVVARATDRAPDSEEMDGVPVIRVRVPHVAMSGPEPVPASQALVSEVRTAQGTARRVRAAVTAPGVPIKRRVRRSVTWAGKELDVARARVDVLRARRAERRAADDIDKLGPRDPWPHWRETLLLPLAIDEAFWPTIRDLDPDVVHTHDLDALAAAGLAHRRLRAAGRDVRLVYDAHENWAGLPDIDWRPRVHNSLLGLEREFVAESDLVITVSDEIADTLRARYSLSTMPSVVLNTPSMRRARPAERGVREVAGVEEGVPLLLYSGSISRARRVGDLIAALPLVPPAHLAVVTVPFPHPMAAEFEQAAADAGVADRVHLVPPVPSAQVVDYLSSATVGVHPLLPGAPNHEMALPNKLFEYAHAGLPLVVSNCRAMSAFVAQHDIGRSFEFGDPAALAAAADEVLSDVARGRYHDVAGAVRGYTWETQEPVLASGYGSLGLAT